MRTASGVTRRRFCGVAAAGVAGVMTGVPVLARETGEAPMVSGTQAFARLPAGSWMRLAALGEGETDFRYQLHGGGAYDSQRHRLVLFGSDTHGKDWTNSPLSFDLETLAWQRAYPNDSPRTYRVDGSGAPVAGAKGDHPWAMHTMGAVEYDPGSDTLVVASHPAHLEPGRFTNAVARIWPAIRRHPTWLYRLATGRWEALPGAAPSFFAYATAFDGERRTVIGLADGIWELPMATGAWRRISGAALLPWAVNAVYDSRHRALIAYGSHEYADVVAVYETETGAQRLMPTPGPRPPGDRYVPMAFHDRLGRTVALIQRYPNDDPTLEVARDKRRMETWLYDLGSDAWERVDGAELPFGWYMNYNLYYLPRQDVLVLVTAPPDERTSVFALRI